MSDRIEIRWQPTFDLAKKTYEAISIPGLRHLAAVVAGVADVALGILRIVLNPFFMLYNAFLPSDRVVTPRATASEPARSETATSGAVHTPAREVTGQVVARHLREDEEGTAADTGT